MASDELRKARRKAKFVVELRFEPMPEAFDRRGEVLRILHTRFQKKMKHWSGENVTVKVTDDLQKPSKQILVEHRRFAVTYEDPGSFSEFVDDAEEAMCLVKDVFGTAMTNVERLGVRFVSILESENAHSYDEAMAEVRGVYLAPDLPISIAPNDFNVTLRHEAGQLIIGPVKKGEEWIAQMFAHPEQRVPDYGIGTDVDSFASTVTAKDSGELISTFRKVLALTQASEIELIGDLINRSS